MQQLVIRTRLNHPRDFLSPPRHIPCFMPPHAFAAHASGLKPRAYPMYYGLYTSAAGANAQSHKVEVLSNNLANVNTVGFKRELGLLQARNSEALERGNARRGSGALEDIGGGVRMNATWTDFSPGTMQLTQIPSDLAIDSPNTFFQVQHGKDKLLTRAGNFHVSNEGMLVTASGDPVLSSDGGVIQIDASLPFRFIEG